MTWGKKRRKEMKGMERWEQRAEARVRWRRYHVHQRVKISCSRPKIESTIAKFIWNRNASHCRAHIHTNMIIFCYISDSRTMCDSCSFFCSAFVLCHVNHITWKYHIVLYRICLVTTRFRCVFYLLFQLMCLCVCVCEIEAKRNGKREWKLRDSTMD